MFCQVIVDITAEEVDRVFTYRVPKGMALCPGMRVHVPFGPRKRLEGVVVDMVDSCDLPPERVKDVVDTLEEYPAILPHMLRLAQQIKETSFCTLSQALRLMIPAQMRGERIGAKTREFAVLTVDPAVRAQVLASQKKAPKRAQVFELLMNEDGTSVYTRTCGDEVVYVVSRFADTAAAMPACVPDGEVLLSNYGDRADTLRPYEVLWIKA